MLFELLLLIMVLSLQMLSCDQCHYVLWEVLNKSCVDHANST